LVSVDLSPFILAVVLRSAASCIRRADPSRCGDQCKT